MTDTSRKESDEIDLRQLAGIFIDNKWLIASITSVACAAGIAYAMFSTPVYQAQAVVQVESKMPSIPGLAELSSLGLGEGSSEATTEIALITSRTVIGQVVDDLKLDTVVEPKRFPVIGNFLARRHEANTPDQAAAPLMGMSRFGWGGEKIDIFRFEVPKHLYDEEMLLVAGEKPGQFELIDPDGDVLIEGTAGESASANNGITLDIAEIVANPGTRFSITKHRRLNVIAGLQQEVKASEQGKESGILRLSYEHEDPEFAETFLQRVAEAYVAQNVDRNSAQASSQLKFVKEQLPEIRLQVEAAQAAMNAYQTRVNSVDISMQTQGLLQQEVAVETSIQQLRLKQAEMDRSFTREHPAYRALLKQIGELEHRKAGFKHEVNKLPDTQQELLRLTRDLQVSNELYTALLNQAQQLDVARAGTVGNVRIVDEAAVNLLEPVKPKKPLIVLVATLLGGFLSVGWVFAQRLMNPGIEDPEVIESLGLPVYASIPLSDTLVKKALARKERGRHRPNRLLAVENPADLSIEAIRSLRTSLHFAMLEARNNILMISGPAPGIGKTFVSSNLGAIIAQSGQRVLVIDADMRKGTLHKAMNVAAKGGLSDLLAGRMQLNEAVRAVAEVPGLFYITRGDAPPNPSELLMHTHFEQLLEEVKPHYDFIIVDTPPILAVTDAAVVAAYTGTNLMVTRFGQSQAKEVELAKKRFEQNGVTIKGAIFNAVERRATGYYSYGYYEYKSENSAS